MVRLTDSPCDWQENQVRSLMGLKKDTERDADGRSGDEVHSRTIHGDDPRQTDEFTQSGVDRVPREVTLTGDD